MKEQTLCFKEMNENPKSISAFFRQQESAPSITLMGPTSSGKSSLITSILSSESNKLLSKNIGITAQTTVIPLMLMLNNRLNIAEVLIQGIERDVSAYSDFKDSVTTELTNALYNERDELDEFIVTEKLIKAILNPENRAFHAYEFAEAKKLITSLTDILSKVCEYIINSPESLAKTANTQYKAQRLKKPSLKKIHIYAALVDERFGEYLHKNSDYTPYKWYGTLLSSIRAHMDKMWTHRDRNVLIVNLNEDDRAEVLMENLYGDNSACSLLYKEIRYVTCPSQLLIDTYRKKSNIYNSRTIKLNVLDTVGLTQTSQERDTISDNMDSILDRDTDALLFLCAADEQPTVYETCISLLHEKQNKIAGKPVIVCRTKADLLIRNMAAKAYQTKTGFTEYPKDNSIYGKYIKEAFSDFLDIFINNPKHDENKLGIQCSIPKMEYVSLAPDIAEIMNPHIDDAISTNRIREILFGLVEQVDLLLNNGKPRLWLHSISLEELPLNAIINDISPLATTIAHAMIAKNQTEGNQYRKYISLKDTYHGRSVNCFRQKLLHGDGHETNAYYYDNFRLFITQMAARWLRELLPKDDLITHINISFEFLEDSEYAEQAKAELPTRLKKIIDRNWNRVIDLLAKRLSYLCQKKEFEESFYYTNWSDGLRKSLSVIEEHFNSVGYWQEHIITQLNIVAQSILQTLYVYD